jgi:hypothetical protein
MSAFEGKADIELCGKSLIINVGLDHISTYRYHERGVPNPALPGGRYPAEPRQA